MPSLKDIKNRIGSVKSTQKITKAMKMISTARLNKAKTNLVNHKEYSNALKTFINSLLPLIQKEDFEFAPKIIQNFFNGKSVKTLVVLISTDKGLCGALNTFLFKEFHKHTQPNDIILAIGKKAFEYIKSKSNIINKQPFLTSKVQNHQEIIDEVIRIVHTNDIGNIKIIFPQFISTMVQTPKTEVIPENHKESPQNNFEIEGTLINTLESVTNELIKSLIQTGLSELLCSEHSARMIAMDNATTNAKKRITSLTLLYNKTRQANITREILEIVAGSQAV